jgi:hypothetical protein
MDPSGDLQGRMNADMLTGFRDDLVRAAGVVTPGVDDTPYIQFAIEALTKDRDTGYSGNESLSSGETLSGHHVVLDQGLGFGYYQPTLAADEQHRLRSNAPWEPELSYATSPRHGQVPQRTQGSDSKPATNMRLSREQQPSKFDFGFSPHPQEAGWNDVLSAKNEAVRAIRPGEAVLMGGDQRLGVQSEKHDSELPPLSYRPWLLRPAAFLTLLVLCIVMVAALIFAAVYSATRDGLVAYSPSGAQYFLFRLLPQLLAAVIVVYTQCICGTMFRILPFARLASQKSEHRERSIYMDLYPGHTLWPKLMDEWEMWMFVFVSWLINLTLPLQSALFTPILVDETWTWGTVQGVAWTVVALYIVLIVSTIITLIEWARTTQTGLLWDPRSIADIIAMLSNTNVAAQYRGTELASHRSTIGFALRHRDVEKLGYWSSPDSRAGPYYAIRSLHSDHPRGSGQTNEKGHQSEGTYLHEAPTHDLEAAAHRRAVRHAHLPWCLRSNQLIFAVVTATVLLVALFVVSFLPSTRLSSGFAPGVPSHPNVGGFSPANFLYSFLPSLLGLILYLLFQSLDLSFRVLQPWAALAGADGSSSSSSSSPSARQSILADYAACLPVQSTLHAAKAGHYRVAALSLLSTLFVFLPILGGGLFTALTADAATGEVRMFPSTPALAVVLALLALYLVALASALPYRHAFRLPHGVTCLAEVIGFLVNDELLRERCFRGVRSKAELEAKMGLGRSAADDGGAWTFGAGDDGVLGVRRVQRFTRKEVRKSQIRKGGDGGL